MSCPSVDTLAIWVDGELTENAAQSLQGHLATCPDCRQRASDLRRLVGELPESLAAPSDEAFVTAVMRRARGAPARPPRLPLALAAAASLAIAGVSLWSVRGGSGSEGGLPATAVGFQARGGMVSRSGVHAMTVYAHPQSDPGRRRALSPGDSLQQGDGLSFEVRNASGATVQLLLFGVDAAGEVHWFHPGWSDPSEDPQSVEVTSVAAFQPLPGGVTPDSPATGSFQVVAVFSPRVYRVSEVERLVRDHGSGSLSRQFAEADVHTLRIEFQE